MFFVYKLSLSLNISDFSFFIMYKLQPLSEKYHPPLSQQPSSKNWDLFKSPLSGNLVGGSGGSVG